MKFMLAHNSDWPFQHRWSVLAARFRLDKFVQEFEPILEQCWIDNSSRMVN